MKPDLLYVLNPTNSVAQKAAKYKGHNTDITFVVDIIDLWPESFPSKLISKTPVFSLWKGMRDYALDQADRIIVECDYYKGYIGDRYLCKCSTLRLQKTIDPHIRDSINSLLNDARTVTATEALSLCYLGSINNIIDLTSIREVLNALKENGLAVNFHLIGKGSRKQELLDIADECKCTVYDHGAVFDEDEKRKILLNCDYGINMMKASVKVGLTMKSMDYLSSALPLINNIKGDTWTLVQEYQMGINYRGDPESLIEEMRNRSINEMKKNAFRCFLDCFSKESFEKRYDYLIGEIIS